MIQVVNKYHRPTNGGVYIGRPTVLSNPYKIGDDGDRDEVCDKYEAYAVAQMKLKGEFYKTILSLAKAYEKQESLSLVCFCAPKRCHGETVKRLILEVLRGEWIND